MTTNSRPIRRHLFTFVASLTVCAGLYYLLLPLYAKLVLTPSAWFIDFFASAYVRLSAGPGNSFSLGYPGAPEPMVFAFDLYVLFMNVIFVPALVVTTLGLTWRALGRSSVALAIMVVLHSFHVTVIVLHFLTQTPNPVIHYAPPLLASLSDWTYKLADKMGFTLFPFVAWISVCALDLIQLSSSQSEPMVADEEEVTHKTKVESE